jgi:hypothetical protein
MTFPTVTEIRLPLEPCTADTFIVDLEPRLVAASYPVTASGSATQERIR